MPGLSPSWRTNNASKEAVLAYPLVKVIRPNPPYPVWFLATTLARAGYQPTVLDERLCDGKDDFLRRISEAASRNPLFIGFSCSMAPQLVLAESYRRSMRSLGYTGPWVLDGIFPSILPSEVVKTRLFGSSGFQILSFWHSFETVVEIARAIEGRSPISNVRGIAYSNSDGEVVKTEPREFPAHLPVPDFDLIDAEKYVYEEDIFIGRLVKTFSLYTSTGCTYGCRFCLAARDRKWISQSPEEVLAQIKYLHDRYKVEYIRLIDDSPLLQPMRILELFRALDREELDIRFYMDLSIPQILSDWFPEAARRLAKVFVGAESGSNRILKLLGKPQEVNRIKEAVKILDRNGIAARYSFMRKLPEEDADDAAATMSLIEWIKRNHSNCTIHISDWTPIYETPLYVEHRAHLNEEQRRRAESGELEDEEIWASEKYREVNFAK